MAKKRGKGGYGSEDYDPKTGEYIKTGDGSNVYHAGVRNSVDQLIEDLKSGAYDDPDYEVQPSSLFANDKDEETEEDEELWEQKNALISGLQQMLDEYNTIEAYKAMDFQKIDSSEYRHFAEECAKATRPQDRDGFYNGYRGDPSSFEFNKALRFGFQKFYNVYPKFLNSYNLNPEAINERAKKLDAITSAWKFPEDRQVYRLVDTAPLISWFKDSGIFDGMEIYTNEFNLEMLKEGYDKAELVKRLKGLIGTKVPPDGSFSSFSCVGSHMTKDLETNKRHIKINYNVRKGTPAFISNYEYESEGLFNRHVGFYIQDAKMEKVNVKGKDIDIIVLEYGIQ